MDRFQASQSEEGRYRMLVESITDYAIYMLDPEGIVSSWNAGAKRFKGYEAGEIIGRHFSEFYTEEDRAAGRPAIALAQAASTGAFQGEGWRVRKDGTRFYASVVIDAIRNAQGELQGFAKITRDLTERRAAERALLQSEKQFTLLVQGVTDYAIYMLDPTGIVSSWNAGAERIKQYRPDEIIGQHFSRFYTEQDRSNGEPERALATALREGRFEKEGTRLRKDGTSFTAHVIIDPVRDDSGKLIGFAKITRDVTERVATQATLEKAREALFQSQKMDAIGQLTGGVAHDFNNLLMAVMGSLEMLDKRLPPDPSAKRLLDNAMQGARRGAVLTQRMLAFARRQPMNPEPVDVGQLVTGMSDLLQRSLGPSIEIEARLTVGLPLVMADANQLELALLNLATNARDAMPEGGKVIIAARERAERDTEKFPAGRSICLSLTDQGEGMDAATLARATEPFFTTKGIGKGTGLGLPMVHGMTEQMGGRFAITSRKGEGTTVEICLPLSQARPAALDGVVASAELLAVKPLTVIVVDDDMLVLFNSVALLEDMGHRVLEAGSGAEALALARTHKADLLITDQAMPQMTGLQLLEALRKEQPGLPVLIATGYAELPADAPKDIILLGKPFTGEELARAIAAIMKPRA